MRKFLFAAVAALVSSASVAQTPAPPKLLIVISVDQFSADLWDEYRGQFTGGFARLASGTVFRNGYHGFAATETCPGHSAILTGDLPAHTGIDANVWGDLNAPRADKSVYCAEDETVPGSTSAKYTVSDRHLRVPTLGELLKRTSPSSMNVAVAGKDRAAVMMSGHSPDQRWYWNGAIFATDLQGKPVPRSVAATNAAVTAAVAAASPPLEPPPFCASKAQPFTLEGGKRTVGNGRLERAAGDAITFRATPQFDGATLALSAALAQELGLGRDAAPDILSIGLSATDYVGHTYGPGGQEMCLQLLSLDRDLGDFFNRLDSWGLDYAVAMTADHGALDIPERLRAKGVADAAWIDPGLTPKAVSEQVAKTTGLAGPILLDMGPTGDIYLAGNLTGADRKKALHAAVGIYRAHPQVEAVFTKEELARTPLPSGDPSAWPAIQRVRASFDVERSGDLYVVLKPNITPIANPTAYVATHGSLWDYDRRVPIIFWRHGMAASSREEHVQTVDIMPTLAAMVTQGAPLAHVDGHCLTRVGGVVCPR